jgi:hypothetical protein
MRRFFVAVLFALLTVTAAHAQKAAIIFCALDDTLDFKIAKAGDSLALHTTRDLLDDGKVLLPRGTPLNMRVVAADETSLSIVLDKATLSSGKSVALMGIIVAVAVPDNGSLSDDPLYGLNNSRTATAQHTQGPSSRDQMSGTSLASSSPEVQTAILKGANEPKLLLSANSQGAIGINGLTLEWVLDKPPATTVFTNKKKNLKIRKGAEMLLRTVPPEV